MEHDTSCESLRLLSRATLDDVTSFVVRFEQVTNDGSVKEHYDLVVLEVVVGDLHEGEDTQKRRGKESNLRHLQVSPRSALPLSYRA